MCGRFARAADIAEVRAQFYARVGVTQPWREDPPVPGASEHIRPTTQVAVIHQETHDEVPVVTVRGARWGLQPVWMTKESRPLINARAETVTEKPAFRSAAAKRRAVIPATSWYEWRKEGDAKQCYRLAPAAGEPTVLWFAGLLEWRQETAEEDVWVASTTIITATPSESIADIHDRAPLVLPDDMVGDWLDSELTDKARVAELIDAVPRGDYTAEPWTLV